MNTGICRSFGSLKLCHHTAHVPLLVPAPPATSLTSSISYTVGSNFTFYSCVGHRRTNRQYRRKVQVNPRQQGRQRL